MSAYPCPTFRRGRGDTSFVRIGERLCRALGELREVFIAPPAGPGLLDVRLAIKGVGMALGTVAEAQVGLAEPPLGGSLKMIVVAVCGVGLTDKYWLVLPLLPEGIAALRTSCDGE